MSVAIDSNVGSKEQYDSEFEASRSAEGVSERDADPGTACGFTCSPFSTW